MPELSIWGLGCEKVLVPSCCEGVRGCHMVGQICWHFLCDENENEWRVTVGREFDMGDVCEETTVILLYYICGVYIFLSLLIPPFVSSFVHISQMLFTIDMPD